MKPKLRRYLINRFREASTWRGIIMLCTGFGATIKPDLMEAIITLGVLLSGAVGAFFPDWKE